MWILLLVLVLQSMLPVLYYMLQDQPKTWSVQFVQTAFRAGLLNFADASHYHDAVPILKPLKT